MNEPASSDPTLRIYGVVLSVGVVCSLAIVSVYEVTRPIIQRNRIAMRETAVLDVLTGAKTITAYRPDPISERFEVSTTGAVDSELVFAGFDSRERLVGVAIETSGIGYQDTIRLLYGYSPDDQAIIGIRILESRETPGLGDRIETDDRFLSNFQHLDVSLHPDGSRLLHRIEFVKPGEKSNNWQIDGISGATISSRATAEMLDKSAAFWVPRVHSRKDDFTPAHREEP